MTIKQKYHRTRNFVAFETFVNVNTKFLVGKNQSTEIHIFVLGISSAHTSYNQVTPRSPVCTYMCVCVREREKERGRECVCVSLTEFQILPKTDKFSHSFTSL
jgi:hypothetical protein